MILIEVNQKMGLLMDDTSTPEDEMTKELNEIIQATTRFG
jgi:hypothetical protein